MASIDRHKFMHLRHRRKMCQQTFVIDHRAQFLSYDQLKKDFKKLVSTSQSRRKRREFRQDIKALGAAF